MKLIRKVIPYLLMLLVTLILFRGVIFNLNSKFFSSNGDGLKAYYCALYHAKFDQDASHFSGMNFPWGESIYFTDGQPPLTNIVRFIDHHIFRCADQMVGIFNFMMILSIFLSSVFLFLIFRKFKMPDWYATLLAMGISLLSPQMGRLSGHFSLSWGFWIPLLIYLVILILENRTWYRSILFAVVTILASLMHMYFFLFSVALVGVILLNWLIFHFERKSLWIVLAHFALQIIIPFVILQGIMIDGVVDRTMHPFGFFAYRAYPGSVFLPINKWYASFLMQFKFVQKYEWEALAYVGAIASGGFWVLFVQYLVNLFRKKKRKVSVTGTQNLDILFWASFILLLFSFGIPFVFGFDKLRYSVSFLSQLRAVGRFSWLFYYVVNIIVWVRIYQYFTGIQKAKLGFTMIILCIAIQGFEAYDYAKGSTGCLNNEVPQLADRENRIEENKWVREVDPNRYQAIMPIPYFHVGSESSWVEARCDIARQMYIASLKTGLPCNGVMLGRTSLSQTYKNIELSKTPWEKYKVINEFPNNKPLLLIVAKCNELNQDEKRLVENSSFILSTPNFDLYEMQIDKLKAIPAGCNYPSRYKNLTDSIESHIAKGKADCFIYRNGNKGSNKVTFNGIRASKDPQRLLEASFKFDLSKKIYIRFWVKDYTKDMVVRSNLLIIQDKPNHECLEEKYSDIFRHIRTFDGEWALIEITLEPKQEEEIIKLLFSNSILAGSELYFDEFSVSQIEL